ncbi:DUF4401 domain-containing protein [Psychrobacter jeotgali]|uniref:DUF4401 domain-containing protein n=1 Tax=Psychrobacter jeotgali TaxID=179010 RepID=UPI00191B1B36|nr:DUF4401 domain-containing protein [Psychrobacter jeotgali]
MNDITTNHDRKHTFATLQRLGFIDNSTIDASTIDNNFDEDSPWFITLFFGFSGLLASLLFVGFLTLVLEQTGALDSATALFSIGLLLSASGFWLFYNLHTQRRIFLSSLAFTISVTGQLYIMFALLSSEIEPPLGVWVFLLIQSYMLLIVPNFMYRLLNGVIVLSAVVYLLSYYQLSEVSLGLLALITIVANLRRYQLLQRLPARWLPQASDITKAVAYASAIVLLGVSVYFIAAEYGRSFDGYEQNFDYNYYLAQGLLTLASLFAMSIIMQRYSVKLLSQVGIIIVCAITLLGFMSVYVSGLLATSLVIIIATANSQRVLLGLGIFALVSYIFWYYYQLDTSLLVKSASMMIIGSCLLLIRWLVIKSYFDKATSDIQERLL